MANILNGRFQAFDAAGTDYASLFQVAGTVTGSGSLITVDHGSGLTIEYEGVGLDHSAGLLTAGSITKVIVKKSGIGVAVMDSIAGHQFLIDTAGFDFLGGAATYNQLLSGNNLIVGSNIGTPGLHELLDGGAGNDVFKLGNANTTISDIAGESTLDLSTVSGVTSVDFNLQTFTIGSTTGNMTGVNGFIGSGLADTVTVGTDGEFRILSGAGADVIDAAGANLYGARVSIDAGTDDDRIAINQFGYGFINGGEGNDTVSGGGDLRYYEFRNVETLENTNFLRVRTEQLRSVDSVTDSNPFNGDTVGFELHGSGTVDFSSLMASGLAINAVGVSAGINLYGTSNDDTFQDQSTGLVNGVPVPSRFFGGGGNDTHYNNSGNAIASFSGNMADYTIALGGGLAPPWIVTDNRVGSPDGVDTLVYFNSTLPILRFADYTASIDEQLAYMADPSQLPAQIYNGALDLFGPDGTNYESILPIIQNATAAVLDGTTRYTVTYNNGMQAVYEGTGLSTSGTFTPSGGTVTSIRVLDTTATGSPLELAHFYSDAASGHLMSLPFTADLISGGARAYQQILSGNNLINGGPNDDIIAATNGFDEVDGNDGRDTLQFGSQNTSIAFQAGSTAQSGTVNFVDDPATIIYHEMEIIADTAERAGNGENIVNNPLPSLIKILIGIFGGDPHVETFDGVGYSFHARGEFVVSKSTVPGDTFEIQARTVSYAGLATVVDQTATKVGTDIVVFDASAASTVFVNGLAVDLSSGPLTLSGGVLTQVAPNSWTIAYDGGEMLSVFEVGASIDFLTLALIPGETRTPGTLTGLLGNADGNRANDFALDTGAVLTRPVSSAVLYSTFADAWRITDATSILDYGAGETSSTFTNTDPPPAFSLADLPVEVIRSAEAVVAAAGISEASLRDFAIYDYILTGDPAVIDGLKSLAAIGSGTFDVERPDAGQAEAMLGVLAQSPSVVETEGGAPTSVTFTIYRTGPAVGTVLVDWAVVDPGNGYFNSADFVGGVLPSGQVSLDQDEGSATVTVELVGGAVDLASERVRIEISSPGGAVPVLGAAAEAEVVNRGAASADTAEAEFIKVGGAGALTHTGDTWTLNLGTITENTNLADIRLAVVNAVGPNGNDLSGMFDVAGNLQGISGASTLLKLAAGSLKGGITADIDTTKPGVFSSTLTLHTSESNDTGYSATLGEETLTINLNITDVVDIITGNGSANVLTGEDGVDRIFGLGGNDTLSALGFNDLLTGGTGRDIMSGGTGLDDFDFNALNEMGKSSSTRDRILDFVHNQDDIDLRTIDAKTGVSGNQAFKFIGTEAFHDVKGELRYFKQNSAGTANDKTIVEGDINGDGRADFQIELKGLISLTKGDFFL